MAEEDLSGGDATAAAIAEIDAAIAAGAGTDADADAGATSTERTTPEAETKVEPPALRLANQKARAVAQREEKLATVERELATAREKLDADRAKLTSEVEFASKARALAEDDVIGLLELFGVSPAKAAAALSGAPQQKTPKEIAELRAEIERLKQGKETETEETRKAVVQQEERTFLSTISAEKFPEVALYRQTRGDKALLDNAYALTKKLEKEGRKGDWTNEELLSLLEQGAKKLHDQVRGSGAKPPPAPARNALTGSAATASTGGTREMSDEERTELAVAEVNRIRKAGK